MFKHLSPKIILVTSTCVMKKPSLHWVSQILSHPMDQLQPLHCPFQQIQPILADAFVNPTWLMKILIMLILFNNVTKINTLRGKRKNLIRYRFYKMCWLFHECANDLPHKLNL